MFKKIILAIISASLLLVLNAPLVMAAGTDDNSPQDQYLAFSYWNIDNIIAVTNDGRHLVFEFPTDFFLKSTLTTETVTLQSTTGSHSLQLSFGSSTLDGVQYMVVEVAHNQEDRNYVHIEFNMVNNVISLSNDLASIPNPNLSVPYFAFISADGDDITSDVVTYYSADYSCVVPYPRDDGSVGFNTTTGNYSSLTSNLVAYNTLYCLGVTQVQLDNVVQTFRDYGYATNNIVPYFDYVTVKMDMNYYAISNSTMDIYLPVGQCRSEAGYNAGPVRVSLWYDKYGNFEPFPTYPDSDIDYGLEEITQFFAIVVSGIFALELFPGIYIGGICFAVFGILFVKAAINFFAGG